MSHTVVLALGGLACGFAAGAAAQFGRLCTFAAIEDALVARDRRRARAWLLAIVVAVTGTQLLVTAGLLDPAALPYGGPTLAVGGLLIGGLLFGFGMALVGTCTFGLLVRLGAGDLRALVSLLVVGITAFAATAGTLADVRLALAASLTFDVGASGGATLLGPIRLWAGPTGGLGFLLLLIGIGLAVVLSCPRATRKPRLLAASVLLGLAVTGGWFVTAVLADPFAGTRVESLSFVAPVGRLLLAVMGQTFSGAAFAICSVLGVVAGSAAVAAVRREMRAEAFDDPREMRRHLAGAVCMGFGGVLAQGCTIGQGLSAMSVLALSAPLALFGMVLGARLGLAWLIEGVPVLFRRPLRVHRRTGAVPGE